jgi:phage tail-like protein
MADAAQQPQSGAQPGVYIDPYRSYNFKLLIAGVTQGHFTYCGNMEISIEPILFREGGQAQVVHRLPGPVDYGEITLRYGLTESRELWDWMMTAVKGKVDRKNVSIALLDADGVTEVVHWDLVNAWACRWRGAPLDTMARQVAIEELTIVFETLERGER